MMISTIRRILPILLYGCSLCLGFGQQNDTLLKSEEDLAKEYYDQGVSFVREGEYNKSIIAYDKAIEMAKKIKDSVLLGQIYTLKGHTYWLDGEYQKAINIDYKALEIHRKTNNLFWECATLTALATVLKRMGRLEKAYEMTKEVLMLSGKSSFKDRIDHIAIITSANEVYLALEEYDSVHYFADKAIKLAKKFDSKKNLIHLYVEKGMAYYYQEQYAKAFEYLFKTKELLETHEVYDEFFPKVLTHYFLASCHYKQQEYDKAITYLLPIIEEADDQDRKKMFVIRCYLLLANCYAKKNNFEKALYWHNEYTLLNTAYEKVKEEVVDDVIKKETQQLELNIKNLKNDQAKKQRQKVYAYSIVGFLIIVLMGWSFVYHKKQRTHKIVFNDLMRKVETLETSITKEVTKSIVIDDQKVVVILKGLDKLEQEEYFLKQHCSLQTMAKRLKTNATYLSKIINTHKQKNFKSYINELRIDYVVTTLKEDPKFRKYTIKAIAQEIGFNNAEAFTKAFNKKTGIYPSYFIKQLTKRSTTEKNVS